jgi:hypothetical protein
MLNEDKIIRQVLNGLRLAGGWVVDIIILPIGKVVTG